MPTENVAPTDASHASGQIPTAPMVDSRALGPNLVDTLWRVIGRFDLYMTSVNAKAALIATFNTFVLTAVVLKWQQIIGQFRYYAATTRLAAVLVSVIAIAAV